jgi:predicted ester cyclase
MWAVGVVRRQQQIETGRMLIQDDPTTAPAALKSIARRHFEEVWNRGNLSAAADIYDPTCVGHCGLAPDQTDYPASEQAIVARDRAGIPDAVVSIDDQVAEGDRVLTRWTLRGTHSVPLFGQPPTGREIVLHGMHMHRIQDGRIVEVWAAPDTLGLLMQVGLVGEPGAPDPREANKLIVRRYLEHGFAPGWPQLLEEVAAEDYVEHGRGWFRVSGLEDEPAEAIGHTESDGREGLEGTHRWLLATFPDLRFRVEQLIAEGDRVAAYSTCEGTQRGAFQGVAPSGRRFRVKRMDIFRLQDGRIAEHWAVRDDLTQAHQIGAVAAWQ